MVVDVLDIERELTGLRQQANYWQALHARACERERAWKGLAQTLEATVHEQAAQLKEKCEENESLKARALWLELQVFGQKSQKGKSKPDPEPSATDVDSEADAGTANSPDGAGPPANPAKEKGKRGKKKGSKGHGRHFHDELDTEEVIIDLPEADKHCDTCGTRYVDFGTEDSQEIDLIFRLVLRIYKRRRYRKDCDCEGKPGIITAPCPPKLIPKGLFSIRFWVWLLLEKFLFQRPLYRSCKVLELERFFASQGTLTGGLERLGELIQPLYTKILERSRIANHWHMDETRWLVFEEVKGKVGHRWWLWVVITRDTCVYLLDPSRSAEVPRKHLGENTEGIISADRYGAYKVLAESGRFLIAFCWFHVRQDFFRIHKEYAKLRAWSDGWLNRINDLFARNARRIEFPQDSEPFRQEDHELRRSLAGVLETCKSELADPALHEAAKKALKSLENHWSGLFIFVDHPEIPMDNNTSERQLRNPVVGRKNYYGSGSVWSGALAAMLFTLFQTMILNGIDPKKHLTAYFEACARNDGKPPEDLDAFLPWNFSAEQKAAWQYPLKPKRAEAPQENKPP